MQEIIYCNIGNPQQLHQKPISFFRQVLALCQYPDLIHNPVTAATFPKDAVARAKTYLHDIISVGAYSHSQGQISVRNEVADFIKNRDGYSADPNSIFLTDGASSGVRSLLSIMLRDEQDGVMIPIPQYPLYSACIPLYGGSAISYYLNESTGWSLSVEELQQSYKSAKSKGITPRALVVINPGNPTGQCLEAGNMADIVEFCVENNVILMADEVYQENTYVPSKPFVSFKKIVMQATEKNPAKFSHTELVSFHSTSKGMIGECGLRGGYFEAHGIHPGVLAEVYKLASVNLCPNVIGQLTVGLMVNPPRAGDPSYALYDKEIRTIYESLKRRAQRVVGLLNSLEGVSCQNAEGAMYCFPQITIPQKAVAAAKAATIAPDLFYCMELLDNAGICTVPGSGFGQRDGTFHFRTTFLPEEEKLDKVMDKMKTFHAEFMRKYQ